MPTESRILCLLSRDFRRTILGCSRGAILASCSLERFTEACGPWPQAAACSGGVWCDCPPTAMLFILIRMTKRKLSLQNYPHRASFLVSEGSAQPVDGAVCLLDPQLSHCLLSLPDLY